MKKKVVMMGVGRGSISDMILDRISDHLKASDIIIVRSPDDKIIEKSPIAEKILKLNPCKQLPVEMPLTRAQRRKNSNKTKKKKKRK